MLADRFPSTHATWLDAQLTVVESAELRGAPNAMDASAARDALRRHVMERYTPALSAYASAVGLRNAGERDEVVGGFYAGPLADPSFFTRWRQSGMPLRRWLMNAVSFHCRSLRRDAKRDRERDGRILRDGTPALPLLPGDGPDAAQEFDRAWALAVVNECYARVQHELAERGRDEDDRILRMHLFDGMPYEEIARSIGRSRNECFNAVRRVATAVRAAVREVLREEGVPESGLDAAVAEIMRLVER